MFHVPTIGPYPDVDAPVRTVDGILSPPHSLSVPPCLFRLDHVVPVKVSSSIHPNFT